MGHLIAKIVGIDKKSRDGKKLYSYKTPEVAGSHAGDIAAVVYEVLRHRFSNSDGTDGPKIHGAWRLAKII